MFDQVLSWVAGLGAVPLYGVVAGLAFAETALFADIVVPGEAGMVIAGVAAARRAGADLPLPTGCGVVGAIAGDSVSYLVGRRIGVDVVQRWGFTRRLLSEPVRQAKQRFEHRGGMAVFLGRFVGAIRALVPLVAGGAGMPYPRFLVWNVAASLVSVPLVVGMGWFAGPAVADALDRIGWLLSAAVLMAAALLVGVRIWRKRRALVA